MYLQRKTDFRNFLLNRLDEFIQFIGIDRFNELEPDDMLSQYCAYAKNAMKISLLHDKRKWNEIAEK